MTTLQDLHFNAVDLANEGLPDSFAGASNHLDGSHAAAFATLIDHVIADPTVLDGSFEQPTNVTLDSLTLPTSDLSHAINSFLVAEPVTEAHLAAYSQDVVLTADSTGHDTNGSTDTVVHDTTTTSDVNTYDPTHDSTVYDPTHDAPIHDATTSYDHPL